jgi:hypothetical protein
MESLSIDVYIRVVDEGLEGEGVYTGDTMDERRGSDMVREVELGLRVADEPVDDVEAIGEDGGDEGGPAVVVASIYVFGIDIGFAIGIKDGSIAGVAGGDDLAVVQDLELTFVFGQHCAGMSAM